ncbi:MAG: hypothetical protein ACOC6G_01405 [Thermoproteota archaeon]
MKDEYVRGLLLAFGVGFAVRLIPELLSFPHPIGWDTVFYAYRISEGSVFGFWDSAFTTWLPYGVTIGLGGVTGWDPFLVLKIVAPMLYGGCAAGMYFVGWKKLRWSARESLLTSFLFCFQLAALAISWQFYRNMFGVMFLLFALPFIKEDLRWREAAWLSMLSVLVVWSHELAAVSLFFIVFMLFIHGVVEERRVPFLLLAALIPAVAIFLASNLGVLHPMVSLGRNIMWLGDSNYAKVGGVYFLTDYLRVSTPYEHYTSYFDLFFHVFSLFLLLYALIMPLIPTGYFKDKVLLYWTGILSVGAFNCIITPFCALMLWNRWMLMLVFPLTFFAAHGVWKTLKSHQTTGSRIQISKKVALCLVSLLVVAGILFMALPPHGRHEALPWGNTCPYIPSSMQRSSIPLSDTSDLTEAYQWLNTRMDNQSCLMVHEAFEDWTLLYLKEEYAAAVFHRNLEEATSISLQHHYHPLYLLWWNPEIEWYHLPIPQNWIPIFHSNRITIYRYSET